MYQERHLQLKGDMHSAKRHFRQSHQKTSLFGSENEEQTDNGYVKISEKNEKDMCDYVPFKKDLKVPAESVTFPTKNKLSQNQVDNSMHSSKIENGCRFSKEFIENELNSIQNNLTSIRSARSSELQEMLRTTDSLVDEANCRAKHRGEEKLAQTEIGKQEGKRTVLQAPWYTEMDDELGKSARTSNGTFNGSAIQISRSKNDQNNTINGKMNGGYQKTSNTEAQSNTPIRRKSAIGESFFNLFGVTSWNSESCKTDVDKKERECSNPSSLRFTPYAQNYE